MALVNVMYIEFVGIPGSGKTTLVEEVRKMLKREYFPCATRENFFSENRTWKYKLFWMLLHPQYLDFSIAVLLYKLSRAKGSNLEKLITRLHEHQKLQYQIAHHHGKIVLWDAGYVQRLSNFVAKLSLNKTAVTKLIYNRLPKESLLVFVDTPVEESITRMKKREPGRRIDGLQELQSRSQQAQQDIFSALATKGILTIKIDGTKSLTENATIVYKKIKNRVTSSHPPSL